MRRLDGLGFTILVLAMVGAGCMGAPSQAFQGPTAVPVDAGSHFGAGKFPIQVLVVEESADGRPVVGAPVVAHAIEKPDSAPTVAQLLGRNTSWGARTDGSGLVTFNAQKGSYYSFISSMPGWTTETRHLIKITDAHQQRPLVIALLREGKSIEVNGSVPTTPRLDTPFVRVFAPGLSQAPAWFPKEATFHPDRTTNRQYVHELLTLRVRLVWTVGAGEYAQFGLRVGFVPEGETAARFYWEADRTAIESPIGTFEETLQLEAPALAHGDSVRDGRLMLGPTSREAVLAPSEIRWNATVGATFGADPVVAGAPPNMPTYGIPATGLPFVLALLAAVALTLTRRP